MRKPAVLMSMLSGSDRWRADRRLERGRDSNSRCNGGAAVLRRLVSAQARQRQTPLPRS